jgi:hypothetical protein
MNSKILLSAAVVLTSAFVSQALACDEHKHNMAAKPIMKPSNEMEGEVCFPYRYTNEKDKTQTLGTLRPRGEAAPVNTQTKPALIGEDLTAEKKVIKPKKRKVAKVKPAVQKDAYNEEIKPVVTAPVEQKPIEPVTPAEQPKVTTPAPTTSTAPVVAPTPVAPEMPKAKEGDAGTIAPVTPSSTQLPSSTAPSIAPENKPAASSHTSSITNVAPVAPATKVANLEYSSTEVEMSPLNIVALSSIVNDLKTSQTLKAKIQSYAYSQDGNMSDARRISLQRAIKIRKYLIDNDINASRISVNAIEDSTSRLNKVEIQLENSY